MTVMAEATYRRQPTRSPLRVLAAAFGLLIAGCQTVVPRGAPPPAAPAPVTSTRPTNDGLPQDQARHRIALLVPTSGANAAVGQSIANAANLALLDTGGKNLRITTYDTAAGAAAAAARAIADGNRLFLGPLLANDVRAVASAARAAKVPVISFSNDTDVAGDGVFLLGFTPSQSIERVVHYARSRGATRFAGLVPAGLYGSRAGSALIKAAEDAGGSVVSMQSYDRSPKAIAAAVQKLGREQGFDAILIADAGRIAVQVAPLIRRSGSPNARLLGTELWNTEPSLSANPAARGAWFASVTDTMYRQLATKYRARFGQSPYRLASLGYDAVLLATRIAGDWKVGDAFPIRRLTAQDGFSGVDGAFRFGSNGIAERALAVHQIDPAGFTIVSPAPRSFDPQ
ncbi:MAG: transporter substrate-binding protein [Sphingomonas bacterium]|nr:transporter substrate-binding protein [Sphingomonas bacterium]